MIELLHVTAHLGGGVGKVLSRLVAESARRGDGLRHVVACLERPEKPQFAEHLRSHGGTLVVCPDREELDRLVRRADLVQVEWWHHPALAAWLYAGELPAMRLVVWSHVSGLYPPVIPPAFAIAPHRFLFTSPCSWEHPALSTLPDADKRRIDAVHSSGGFDDLPWPPERVAGEPLRVGYLGTLNRAKLTPDLLDYLAAVRLPGFRLALVGDAGPAAELQSAAAQRGMAGLLEVRGYRADVAEELAGFDVFAYLLNHMHYGTTENALLEAMAMGVVPVVLNNPAERVLVRHGETGLIVEGPEAFAAALDRLAQEPGERLRMSANAASAVRQGYSVARTADRLWHHYQAVLDEARRPFDFRPVFGATPGEWFRTCQGSEADRFSESGQARRSDRGPHFLYEKTKGSVFHYRTYFPEDARLAYWANCLETHS